jgi:hypothetical protein
MWRMTDDELITGFENCTLPNEAFHHEEHVRVGFFYLSHHPVLKALELFSSALVRFAAAHGKTNLYNETVTWAYLFIIRERMLRAPGSQTWEEFKASNQDLLQRGSCVLTRYYRPETLQSELAKTIFLFPDRL